MKLSFKQQNPLAMSGTLDEGFDEEAYAINRQFKSFKRRYLKAKEDKK